MKQLKRQTVRDWSRSRNHCGGRIGFLLPLTGRATSLVDDFGRSGKGIVSLKVTLAKDTETWFKGSSIDRRQSVEVKKLHEDFVSIYRVVSFDGENCSSSRNRSEHWWVGRWRCASDLPIEDGRSSSNRYEVMYSSRDVYPVLTKNLFLFMWRKFLVIRSVVIGTLMIHSISTHAYQWSVVHACVIIFQYVSRSLLSDLTIILSASLLIRHEFDSSRSLLMILLQLSFISEVSGFWGSHRSPSFLLGQESLQS